MKDQKIKYECPNCGADLPEETVICPYCGYENEKLAKKAYDEEMDELSEKHVDSIKTMPKKMMKKSTKLLIVFIVGLALVFVTTNVLRYISGTRLEKLKYDNKQKMIEHLEELYQAGDYETMGDDFYDSNYFGDSFGKYANTAEIYYDVKFAKESLIFAAESEKYSKDTEELSNYLRKSFWALIRVNDMRDKGFIYGEGDAIEKLEADLISTMKETWLITDEEIKEGLSVYVDRNTDYTGLAKTLIDRKSSNK